MGIGFKEMRDQINRTEDSEQKEKLQRQFEAMHQEADEESKLYEDLIRGDWRGFDE